MTLYNANLSLVSPRAYCLTGYAPTCESVSMARCFLTDAVSGTSTTAVLGPSADAHVAGRLRELCTPAGGECIPLRTFAGSAAFSIGRRPVVWNPFAARHANVAIHQGSGEGEVKDESGGFVDMLFPEQRSIVRLAESSIVRPSDPEAYRSVMAKRAEKYAPLAPFFAVKALKNYLTEGDYAPIAGLPPHLVVTFLQRKVPAAPTTSESETVSARLWEVGERVGIDVVAFILALTVGERPTDVSNDRETPSLKKDLKFNHHGNGLAHVVGGINRMLTPDVVRHLFLHRPWQAAWKGRRSGRPPTIQTAGNYFPKYYPGADKPNDLTALYFSYRQGEPEAFRESARRIAPLVDAWADHPTRKGNAVVVPMIGTAPNEALARSFGHPVLFPWAPRPDDYGRGVEGERAMVKLRLVKAALKLGLTETFLGSIRGRSVLLLDDNVTDGVTYMVARNLLLEKGAAEVSLIALTGTIRSPSALEWSPR